MVPAARQAGHPVDDGGHGGHDDLDRGLPPAARHAGADLEVGQLARTRSAKESVSDRERPIVRPSRMPLTDSDSCTIEEIVASWRCRSLVIRRRSVPTRRLIQTNTGSMSSETTVSRQSSATMATIVATTVVRLETSEVAVEVTVACIPPMSLAIRDWTSPVRVRVKKASGIRWRWA